MSSGQIPRRPEHFPLMKHRARKRETWWQWRGLDRSIWRVSNDPFDTSAWSGLLEGLDWDGIVSQPVDLDEPHYRRLHSWADQLRDVLADTALTWPPRGGDA